MKIKILVNTICFFFLTIVISFALSGLFANYIPIDDDRTRMDSVYNEKPNHIDVLVIGPSSTFCSWAPIYAWNKYGITSITFSFGHFPISVYKYAIKEVLKTQKPKVIVVYTDAINNNTLNHNEYILYHKFLMYMPLTKNKIDMIMAICKECQLNLSAGMELLFPVIRYHSEWKMLLRHRKTELFDKCIITFFPFYKKGKTVFFQKHQNVSVPKETEFEFKEDKKALINDLFQYLEQTHIPVLITNFPNLYYDAPEEQYIYNMTRNHALFKMAKERGFSYYNFMDFKVVKDMNIKNNEFSDHNHFNYRGTYKYTKYLAKYIIDKYNIEDKRNNESYSSWNKAYINYIQFVQSRFNIDIVKEFNDIDNQK